MDEFLVLLQAKLDEAALNDNVKGKLNQLKKDFSELIIKPVIDPQALSNIVKQLESITGKKITIPNIEFNAGQAVKDAQQVGKQVADSFNQSAKQISLDKEINKQVNSLMESFGIHGKNAFNEIKNALIEYRQELLNTTSSTKVFDDIFDLFADNSSSIDKVTSAIANNMKVANDAKSVYQSLVEYIAQTNKSGSKIYIPNSIKSEYGQDFNSMRSILGSSFTSDTKYKNSLDFENFVTELNSQLGNVIDMSHGAEAAFSDLVNKVKSTKGSNYLSADELFGKGYLNKSEMISQIDLCIDSINQAEKELAQQSSVATDKVVQNEERKQQAYRETANVQKSTQNTTFDLSQNEQKIEQFKNSLAGLGTVDGKYIDNLSERFGKLGIQIQSINASLSEVAVHEKGEYIGTKEILTSTLNGIDKFGQVITLTEAWDQTNHEFVRSLDAVGSSFQNVQKQATNYENKLNDLKTKLSGTAFDTSNFENMLVRFRNGEISINELSSAFNQLKNSSERTLKGLNSQDSSLDKITQAKNTMRDLPSRITSLTAEMDKLKDKSSLAGISIKDLSSTHNSLLAEMNSVGGNIPLTDQWITKFRDLSSTVSATEKQVEALKKAEASDNSQVKKQAEYYSSIISDYRKIYEIKKKLVTAGEKESVILQEQKRLLSASIASNYKQIKQQGLQDTDWQKQINNLKKENDYSLQRIKARQSDKAATQEAANAIKEQQQELSKLESAYQRIKDLQVKKNSLDTSKDAEKIAHLNNEIKKAQQEYNKIYDITRKHNGFDLPEWQQLKANIDAATKSKIDYNNASKQDIFNSSKNTEIINFSTLKSKWEEQGVLVGEFKSKVEQMESSLVSVGSKGELDGLKTKIQSLKNEASTLSHVNKIQLSIDTGGYESKVESLIAKTRQWTDVNGNARISTTALSNALTKLTQASEAYANNKSEATQKRLIESSKNLDTEYQKITNDVRKMNAEMAKDTAISSLHNQVNDFMSKNGKAVKYSGEFMRIFNETAQGAKLTREEIAKLNQEFNNAVAQARNAGKLGKTFFQTLREGMSSFSYWTSSTFLVMKAIQSVKGGLGTVKALDTALVDLKKTTTMTNSELEDFYYSSNKVAKQMGVATDEIINQAAAWSRLGYSSNEAATKMAKFSSKFASISPGMSTDEAQEGLVSIIKAWGLDVDEVEREVMDNINTLGRILPKHAVMYGVV